MSELPNSWAQVPLAAITSDVPQRVPADDEMIRYIDIGSVNRTTKRIETPQKLLGKDAPSRARKQVAAGDTLVSMTRPNLNAVALVPQELDGEIASTGFDVLRPVPGVDPRWISYLVRTEKFVDSMSALVQGALYPAVRSKDVRAHVVPLAPAAEQTRIANQLDTLLTRIQSCNDRFDAIPALLKRFRQAVLRTAIDGSLTENWRSETQSRALYAAEQGKLARNAPVSWEAVSFESLLADVNKLSYGVLKPDDPVGNSVSMFRVVDIGEWGKRAVTAPSKISASLANQYLRTKIEEGDVLLSVMATIGRAMVASDSMVGANVNRALAVIKPDHNKVKSQFLLYLLLSPQLIEAFEKASIGSAQLRINLGDLRRFEVALPSLLEQAEIVRRVEALFALVDRIEIRATAARALAQRLINLTLAKAFRGELVPQDPQDEPDSVLLELIASQRTGPAAKKTSKPPRQVRASRAPKEAAAVTKSRQDEDVKGKPYLADHLRRLGVPTTAEALFKASELPIADFYKQLIWEVAQGHIADGGTTLEARHAAG